MLLRFCNLVPREALESFWDTYNLLGESWGISVVELGTIISSSSFLTEKLGKCVSWFIIKKCNLRFCGRDYRTGYGAFL